MPDPITGELKIDPDIDLKAKKFNLAISFFYSSQSTPTTDRPYGFARGASVGGYVDATNAGRLVVRGDFSQHVYTLVGTSGTISTYTAGTSAGATTSLSYNSTPDEYTEYFNDGMKLVYGHKKVEAHGVTYYFLESVADAVGNKHTYAYGSGIEADLLKTITVPGGRLVTFLYTKGTSNSLLSTVQDWSGRRWTFQYDSHELMTTMTAPTGCITKYGYAFFAGPAATLVRTIEDPRGYITTYMYDANRHVTSMLAGTALWTWTYSGANALMTTPAGAITTYAAVDQTGVLTYIDRPEGYRTTFTYQNRLQ
jgi:YD repeat-containing protein